MVKIRKSHGHSPSALLLFFFPVKVSYSEQSEWLNMTGNTAVQVHGWWVWQDHGVQGKQICIQDSVYSRREEI